MGYTYSSSPTPRREKLKAVILNSGYLMSPEQLEVICEGRGIPKPERAKKGAMGALNDYLQSRPDTRELFFTTTTTRNVLFA